MGPPTLGELDTKKLSFKIQNLVFSETINTPTTVSTVCKSVSIQHNVFCIPFWHADLYPSGSNKLALNMRNMEQMVIIKYGEIAADP